MAPGGVVRWDLMVCLGCLAVQDQSVHSTKRIEPCENMFPMLDLRLQLLMEANLEVDSAEALIIGDRTAETTSQKESIEARPMLAGEDSDNLQPDFREEGMEVGGYGPGGVMRQYWE
ncbi:hypothetical protein BDW74DRAFT_182103 [Aspergillus multicolor]|uniref:uncharacterized protein n=1 Tax=Aspergillus multicolor TaxID=41759 RepID=UPI003CCCD8B4